MGADVFHVGVAEQDPGEVFLTDGGQAPGVGQELNLKHLRLQVVHETEGGVGGLREENRLC